MRSNQGRLEGGGGLPGTESWDIDLRSTCVHPLTRAPADDAVKRKFALNPPPMCIFLKQI